LRLREFRGFLMVVLLSGGTGGARLARGLLDHLGPDRLAVIANTGDDIAAFGLHVSPDPDLVTYWLAGVIDEERGFGIAGESTNTFDQLVKLGAADWFRLGDQDLATCLMRTELLHEGSRLTEIARAVAEGFGVPAAVLPMCDEPVQTYVRTEGEWRHFQEYLILQHSKPQLEGVEFRGAETATLSDEVRLAIDSAEAIVIGPSNPIASIGPILAVPGLREALVEADAPVVAVSPLVGGHSLKGPTEAFLTWAGLEVSDAAIASQYAGLVDGLVIDKGSSPGGPTLSGVVMRETDTLMSDADARVRVARETLEFAQSLAG
jgi:LPPG:FO 2-phospho-L-lactate transferase